LGVDATEIKEVLRSARILITDSFPEDPGAAFAPFPDLWLQCQTYIQHLLAICERCEEYKLELETDAKFVEFGLCLSSAGR